MTDFPRDDVRTRAQIIATRHPDPHGDGYFAATESGYVFGAALTGVGLSLFYFGLQMAWNFHWLVEQHLEWLDRPQAQYALIGALVILIISALILWQTTSRDSARARTNEATLKRESSVARFLREEADYAARCASKVWSTIPFVMPEVKKRIFIGLCYSAPIFLVLFFLVVRS